MRVVLSVGVVVCALIASALITAQTRNPDKKELVKKEPQPDTGNAKEKKARPAKPADARTARTVVSRLQLEIDTQQFRGQMRFKEFLVLISEQLQNHDQAVTINVDVEAFMRPFPDAPEPLEENVVFIGNRKRATVMELLSQAVKRVGGGNGAFIVRAGRVDVLPSSQTTKEYTFNQTFRADFKDQRLDLALEELSDLTGVSIVIDARARQKAQTTVNGRFNDDVAMQDAVRMLTDMAELKIVYLVTSMYITTPEHAKEMQKELKDLYELKAPANPFGFQGAPLPDPNINVPPDTSPLAPPLPPLLLKARRLEAAA